MNYVGTDKDVFKTAMRQCVAKVKGNKITLTCKVNTPDEDWNYRYVIEWTETMEDFSAIWGLFERKLNAHFRSINPIETRTFSLNEGLNRMDSMAARALRFLIKEYKEVGVQAIADFNSRSIPVSASKGF